MNSIQHRIDVLNDELLRMENEIKKKNLISARKLVAMSEKLMRYGQAMSYYIQLQEEWNKREMEKVRLSNATRAEAEKEERMQAKVAKLKP